MSESADALYRVRYDHQQGEAISYPMVATEALKIAESWAQDGETGVMIVTTDRQQSWTVDQFRAVA